MKITFCVNANFNRLCMLFKCACSIYHCSGNEQWSSPIGRTYKRVDSVCPHEPFSSRAFPQSVPPVPPGSVWLHVCGPTWLAQGQSVPVEAAMAADNVNWHPVITTNCPTARNWADTLGGACLSSVCVSSVCVQAKLKFCITLTLWENCFFQLVT